MAQDTMIETKEQAAEFLQRLSKDRQPEQFPDLIFGVLRALKQDMQRDEAQPDCDKTENMLRYSERAALTALCCCCNETGMGGVRTSLIGEMLDLAPSTVTPLLDVLEQKGFLTRRRLESDRRVVVVSPTAQGWEAARYYRQRNMYSFAKLLCWFGEEDAAQMLRILGKISDYYGREGH